jgi:hypothetical protein
LATPIQQPTNCAQHQARYLLLKINLATTTQENITCSIKRILETPHDTIREDVLCIECKTFIPAQGCEQSTATPNLQGRVADTSVIVDVEFTWQKMSTTYHRLCSLRDFPSFFFSFFFFFFLLFSFLRRTSFSFTNQGKKLSNILLCIAC